MNNFETDFDDLNDATLISDTLIHSKHHRTTPDQLLLESAPNIGPLVISRWELDKFRNCWNERFNTSKFLTLLYQQFSNLSISQQDISGPRY